MRPMLKMRTRVAYGARARGCRKQPHARVPHDEREARPQAGRTTLWMMEEPS